MKAPRLRDAWIFRRPAGSRPCPLTSTCWGDAQGWTVWVEEVYYGSRPVYVVRTRMWEPAPHTWTDVPEYPSLHAARVRACGRVLVLAGADSAEALGRRSPRGRYIRDGKTADPALCPWRWFGTAFADESLSR